MSDRLEMDENLKQITDGRFYEINDMVKVGCHDCQGCSQCCRDMGQSILLDPMDVFRLEKHLNQSFEELLTGPLELHVEDGLILPNLKMQEYKLVAGEAIANDSPQCYFLNAEGRCSIHGFRPGICRLFPLGRNYYDDKLNYFLLTEACPAKNKSKMKVSKWLDTDGMKQYQDYLVSWHSFTKKVRAYIKEHAENEELTKQMTLVFLQLFYMRGYTSEDFYSEFEARLLKMEALFEA